MRRWLWLVVGAVILLGCGGSDDGVSASGDVGGDDGGSEAVLVGGDLDVPDWFPSPFSLPEGMTILQATNEPGQQRMGLDGHVPDGDTAAIREQLRTGLQADGYELISDSEDVLVFVKNGVGRVRVFVSDRDTASGPVTGVRVDIDTWTDEQLDQLRAVTAEEVVGPGRAHAVVDGVAYDVDGECHVKGRSWLFVTTDDLALGVSVDGDPPTLVNMGLIVDDVAYDSGDAAGATVDVASEAAPLQFTASATLPAFSATGQVDATVEVTCE